MKKLFSILFALMILFSGLHISMATHICGGKIAAVKWSVSDQTAECGMETMKECTSETAISRKSCCSNEISHFTVDSNYSASTILINSPVLQLLQVYIVPQTLSLTPLSTTNCIYINVRPPGNYIPDAVSLTDICVFLI